MMNSKSRSNAAGADLLQRHTAIGLAVSEMPCISEHTQKSKGFLMIESWDLTFSNNPKFQ